MLGLPPCRPCGSGGLLSSYRPSSTFTRLFSFSSQSRVSHPALLRALSRMNPDAASLPMTPSHHARLRRSLASFTRA